MVSYLPISELWTELFLSAIVLSLEFKKPSTSALYPRCAPLTFLRTLWLLLPCTSPLMITREGTGTQAGLWSIYVNYSLTTSLLRLNLFLSIGDRKLFPLLLLPTPRKPYLTLKPSAQRWVLFEVDHWLERREEDGTSSSVRRKRKAIWS